MVTTAVECGWSMLLRWPFAWVYVVVVVAAAVVLVADGIDA